MSRLDNILYISLFLLFPDINFAFDLPRKCVCDLRINDVHYNISQVYNIGNGNVYPTDAHYDVYGNLFYVETNHTDEGFIFNIKVVKFKSTVPRKIPGLPEGISYSIAVDKKLTKVYFGTGRGIFIYDYETESASPISNVTLKLNMIFVDKNSNKYIIENVDGIDEFYHLDGEKKIQCHSLEALNEMAIDDDDNFYFIRDNKLYVLKSTYSTTLPLYIGNVTYQGVAQITFHNNNVFIASHNLVYIHENDSGSLKNVDNIPGNVTAMAFDNSGHFILGVQGKIFKYEKNDCYLRNNRVIDEYADYNIH